MNSETSFCLRVDVDTFEGLTKGIPKVLEISKKHEIPISIYLSLGKYETGRNLFRKIQKKEKIVNKIPPWKRNSLKSLLRGIILPAKNIGDKEKKFLQRIDKDSNVEIHPHGYNHVRWSSKFPNLSKDNTSEIISNLINEYTSIFQKKPIANAAPNFSVNKHYFQALVDKKFKFSADFRYPEPFVLQLEEKKSQLTQLPVTESTIEDHIAKGKSTDQIVSEYKKRFDNHVENGAEYVCFYVHAVYEPLRLEKTMNKILSYVNKYDFNATTHSKFHQKCSKLRIINIQTLLD
jgi:undecaprenyl phosphate-alpha-L-ara4FN deformylase